MKVSKQLKGLAVGITLALGTTTTAHADLIGAWDYLLEAGFTGSTYVPGDGTINETGDSGSLDLPTSLAWGVPANDDGSVNPLGEQSSLVLTSAPLTGTVATQFNDDASALAYEPGTTITHNNFVITDDSAFLDSTTIQDFFTLDAAAPPPNGSNTNQNPAFNVTFAETENFPDPAGCSAPSGNTPPTGCQDIFTLDLLSSSGVIDIIPSLTGPILVIDEYTIEDFAYQVLLRSTIGPGLAQLALLTDDQCAETGAPSGCVGVLTQEDASNTLQLEFAIRAQQVPAPGVLALLGLGLLGMLSVRRQKAA